MIPNRDIDKSDPQIGVPNFKKYSKLSIKTFPKRDVDKSDPQIGVSNSKIILSYLLKFFRPGHRQVGLPDWGPKFKIVPNKYLAECLLSAMSTSRTLC